MTLIEYLRSCEKKLGQKQTHTWFGMPSVRGGYTTKTLHVKDTSRLRSYLHSYVKTAKDVSTGPNSISEKVSTRFRFFADIDVKAEAIKEWAANRDDWKDALLTEMRELVGTCKEALEEVCGSSQPVVIVTRLPYKVHLHFPSLITDRDNAKKLCAAMRDKLQGNDLFHDALDESVYSTGLRLLWCHKGSMNNAKKDERQEKDKVAAERDVHESLFGQGTWSEVYDITDEATWEKKKDRTLKDLRTTSIVAGEEEPLTPLKFASPLGTGTGTGTGTGKKRSGGKAGTTRPKKKANVGKGGDAGKHPQALEREICEAFSIDAGELSWDGKVQQGGRVSLPTRSKRCEFADREHASNHVYLVLSEEGVRLRCHDQECTDSRLLSVTAMDLAARQELHGQLGIAEESGIEEITEITEDMRLTAVADTIGELRKLPEGRNLDLRVDPRSIHRTDLNDTESYICNLSENRYCVICDKEHDEPQNCVLVTMRKLKLLCYKDNFRNSISIPLLERHGNIIFANQVVNNNLNITVSGLEKDVRDFGGYDSFPRVHKEDDLSKLCFKSLSGRSGDIARYAIRMMEGKYAYHEEWYWFTGTFWKSGTPPDDLLMDDISDIYDRLQTHYNSDKQVRWLDSLKDDLGNLTKRKVIIEDMERQVRKQGKTLPLGDQAHLIGFQNGVFDSKLCIFRPAQDVDYLTEVLSYSLPEEADPEKLAAINRFMEDVLPQDTIREFVWDMLSQHLVGANEVQKAMVWTGSGGNGKGMLKYLMSVAFEGMHSEPRATFLTSEVPAPDRPAPHLVNLRRCRSVFASEPESNKKANTAFVKFITGNDIVECRACHKNEVIKYYPRFLVTLLCNAVPKFEGAKEETRGLWRRLVIIKFEQEFVDGDPVHPWQRRVDTDLKQKMETWGPTFMRMLIDNYINGYVKRGRTLTIPSQISENLDEQRAENDPLDYWLQAHLRPQPGKRIHLHRFEIYWKEACRLRGIKDDTFPCKTTMTKKLQRIGYELTGTNDRQRDAECSCRQMDRYIKDADIFIPDEEISSV